jgi:hypothetical protein
MKVAGVRGGERTKVVVGGLMFEAGMIATVNSRVTAYTSNLSRSLQMFHVLDGRKGNARAVVRQTETQER